MTWLLGPLGLRRAASTVLLRTLLFKQTEETKKQNDGPGAGIRLGSNRALQPDEGELSTACLFTFQSIVISFGIYA